MNLHFAFSVGVHVDLFAMPMCINVVICLTGICPCVTCGVISECVCAHGAGTMRARLVILL